MRWFMNLRVMHKLMLGFVFVGMIMATEGYVGVSNMERINGVMGTLKS